MRAALAGSCGGGNKEEDKHLRRGRDAAIRRESWADTFEFADAAIQYEAGTPAAEPAREPQDAQHVWQVTF